MNREQEHHALRQEPLDTPPELEEVLAKAQARAKKRKTIRSGFAMPLGTIAALFILFVGLVNLSPAVAAAMVRIPGLQQLTEFVSFSPSLTEAVEQEFVQSLGLEHTIDDVVMRIEHIIVDGQQLHIFYTLDSPISFNLEISVSARGAEVVEAHEDEWIWATLFLGLNQQIGNGITRKTTIGFDELVPPVVIWEGEVFADNCTEAFRGRLIGEYSFTIRIDEAFTGQQEVIPVDYEFVLDGQRLTITIVELNPAHTRVNIEADWENNTEQLQRLVFHMVNEWGERFDPPAPEAGLINLPAGGDGREGPWRMEDHFLETAFFTESEHLTLVITGVEWIGMEWMGTDTVPLETPLEIRIR